MKIEVNGEIINILKKELERYRENIEDILKDFQNTELDISDIAEYGFEYQGPKSGTPFINELRTFFHKKNIDHKTSLWIINKWGGIGTFKGNDLNINRIKNFYAALKKRQLTKDLFGVISSLSKIASFMDYEEYFVYDSRAIYTLNWLILKNNIPDPKFFPMPASRTKNLIIFDLDTIINLFYKEKIQDKGWHKDLFFDHKHAYFIYCDLIKELNKMLFPKQKPYYLEMLLYTIAGNEIFNELRSSVQLKII